ncbi:DUF5659 domain-containing protein [Anaeromonas frigoriresistens]|uniref:DUF5659 domain-containing protein n=1 Tax=Anaeromonas frigoriresistens TaxID=2683708 RepID=UPI0033162853
MKDNNQFYVIKSIKMMTYLIRAGFDLYRVIDDDKNSHYKVFLFNDSDELRSAMFKYNN